MEKDTKDPESDKCAGCLSSSGVNELHTCSDSLLCCCGCPRGDHLEAGPCNCNNCGGFWRSSYFSHSVGELAAALRECLNELRSSGWLHSPISAHRAESALNNYEKNSHLRKTVDDKLLAEAKEETGGWKARAEAFESGLDRAVETLRSVIECYDELSDDGSRSICDDCTSRARTFLARFKGAR